MILSYEFLIHSWYQGCCVCGYSKKRPQIYSYLDYASQEVQYIVSYCLRVSVEKIGLWWYVQYYKHMAVTILVRRVKNSPRPCEGHSQELWE